MLHTIYTIYYILYTMYTIYYIYYYTILILYQFVSSKVEKTLIVNQINHISFVQFSGLFKPYRKYWPIKAAKLLSTKTYIQDIHTSFA